MKNTYDGELLSVDETGIYGWAWDSERPYEAVQIDLLIDGEVVKTVKADHFSMSLVNERKGNGLHAFLTGLTQHSHTGYPCTLTARFSENKQLLAGEFVVETESELNQLMHEPLLNRYRGYVDGIENGLLSGWVVNSANPEENVELSLYDGINHLADTRANILRKDVRLAGILNENCGFSFTVPIQLLDEKLHSLHVKVKDEAFELENSPIGFGTNQMQALNKAMTDLKKQQNKLFASSKANTETLEQLFDEKLDRVLERFDALFSIQRDSFEKEMQVLRNELAKIKESKATVKLIKKESLTNLSSKG